MNDQSKLGPTEYSNTANLDKSRKMQDFKRNFGHCDLEALTTKYIRVEVLEAKDLVKTERIGGRLANHHG